jgi:hypothetical protein
MHYTQADFVVRRADQIRVHLDRGNIMLRWIELTASLCLMLTCGPTSLWARQTASTQPRDGIYVELHIKGDDDSVQRLKGLLKSHDALALTFEPVSMPIMQVRWDDLTPTCAYTVRSRLIDRDSASDWFELGEFAWNLKLDKPARTAFANARRLDSSLNDRIDAILKAPARQLPAPVPKAESGGQDDGDSESVRSDPTEPSDRADRSDRPPSDGPSRNRRDRQASNDVPLEKFKPATEAEHAASMSRARSIKGEVAELLQIEFAEIETDHFLIFTDWNTDQHAFLRDNCETAYRLVAKQFKLSPKDNIFVGKLPVFMFERQSDFLKFARDYDEAPFALNVAGYYSGRSDGIGHLVMWKPRPTVTGNAGHRDAERRWANTLVHEFCHAFVARYRSNGRIPRWVNEGIAEYIAQSHLPEHGYFAPAREAALLKRDISYVFDDENIPGWQFYPVMMSLIDLLVKEKPDAFLPFFNDLKDGLSGELALRKHYGIGYADLEMHWREYARKLR